MPPPPCSAATCTATCVVLQCTCTLQHYTVTALHYKNTATICNPRQCLTCSADDAVALPHCKYTEALHYNTNTNTLQIQIHCLQNLSAMHYLPSSAQLLQLQCIIYCTTCTAFLLHDNALMSRIAVHCFNAQRKYPHHCCCSETLRDNAFIMQ